MLGIFLIICLLIYLFIEFKTYRLHNESCDRYVELSAEVKTYEASPRLYKFYAMSISVVLTGYLVCTFPFLFIKGVETGKYISGIGAGIIPVLALAYAYFVCIKNLGGYIRISTEILEWKGRRSFCININEIQKITCTGLDAYQVHLKDKYKKPLIVNTIGFSQKSEIRSLMKQLREHVAKLSGKDKTLIYKINCSLLFGRSLSAYVICVKTVLFLLLLYASYCCIDYDFCKQDYTALYNRLHTDRAQSENAWTYYVQAAQDYVELNEDMQKILDDADGFENLQLTEDQKALIVNWFNDNALSWGHLKKAVSISYCNARYKDISLFSISGRHDFSNPCDTGYDKLKYLYSNVTAARSVGILTIDWFALFEMQLAASRHFMHGKSFIDQLVGYAMLNRAVDVVVDRGSYDIQDLRRIKAMLLQYFPDGVPQLSIEGEVLISCGLFDDMIKNVNIPVQSPLNPMFAALGSMNGTGKYVQKRYKIVLEDAQNNIEREPDAFSFISFPVIRKMLVAIVEPTLYKVYKISQRTQTTLLAADVILDLEEYKLTKGCYPIDAFELVKAGLIIKLPDDPDARGSIIYSNDGKRAVLYALGKNGKDDGGYKDTRKSAGERDDRVFWQRQLKQSSATP